MKNLIVFMLFLCIQLSSFAADEIYKIPRKERKQYVADIEKIINDKYDDSVKDIQLKTQPIENIYKTFIDNENNMKVNKQLVDKLDVIYSEFDTAEFYLYSEIIDKTNKYVNYQLNIPATDYTGTLKYFIYPYLNKYKVNTEKLDNLSEITAKKSNAINKIKNEIIDFSTDYENKKVDKFYNKYIVPKESQLNVVEIWHDYLWKERAFKTNVLYWARPNIIQTFNDGFLADASIDSYDAGYKTYLIEDKDSYKLDVNDNFERPFIIVFTGRYFPYITVLGQKKNVPVFRLFTENDLKAKISNPPKFNETLYFITKPDYTEYLKKQSERLLIRPITLFNNSYYYVPNNMYRVWKN